MKVNLKKIEGNWDVGYALDKHSISSTVVGHNEYGRAVFETIRTEAGEAVFQLKYRSDWERVGSLADAVVEHIIPNFGCIGLVLPVPASTKRERQPVHEVARAIASRINVESFETIIEKTEVAGVNVSIKDLQSKEQKVAALQGRFRINNQITNEGRWNALVVDDLFHTGASMEAVCAALRTYGKIDRIFVATLTWR